MAGPTPQEDKALSRLARYADVFSDAAEKYGISETYLQKVAFIESSGNPNARQGSSRGLMQFQPAAARELGLKNPYDPVASIYAAAKLAVQNRDYLTDRLGREPKESELYLAHQQGRYGAAKILENPDRTAAAVLAEFHKRPGRAIAANGGHRDMSCEEFAGLWDTKYNAAPDPGNEDKNIHVDPDFAAVARGEKPPGASSGYSDDRPGNSDLVARNFFNPSTVGEAYYSGTFNDASQHTSDHEQRMADLSARQIAQANLAKQERAQTLTGTFQRHGFGDKTWPGANAATHQDSGIQATADSPPPPQDKKPEQESPAPAFKHNIFTPIGNG